MGKMGSTRPADLGLDLKLGAARAAAGFLKSDPISGGESRAARLAEALQGLEEERSKIEAFKRELPISILIVSDVIRFVKDELEQCRSERGEEFKFELEKKSDIDFRDKMNWMSSTKLWSDNHENNNNKNIQEKGENLSLESKSMNGGGAFVPYKGSSSLLSSLKKEEKPSRPIPSMADDYEHRYAINNILSSKGVVRDPISSHELIGHLSLQTQHQQLSRKSRRCWSPQLHRRFVLALQQLGGAQVATPKQIGDLMKVEGLTNDEMKSHLQKYRLHNRKAPNSIATSVQRPVVVVGGLWAPHEQCTASPKTGSHSGSPQGPLQLSGSARADSFTAGDSCEDGMKSESSTRN